MQTRAWATLDVKSFDDEQRIVEGIASTPSTDRAGDIVEPKGARFALPLPLLWQHQADTPIGHVISANVTDAGIHVTAKLAKTDQPGETKNTLDKAWESIKLGLVRGLSIGFRATEVADIKGSWGKRFVKWEWLELSAVTIPANADASITSIKSIDTELLAASGRELPRARGPVEQHYSHPERKMIPKTTAERIAAFEAARAAKAARMQEVSDAAAERGETKNESEQDEFDGLRSELGAIDRELKDLRDLESLQIKKAVPVEGASPRKSDESRAPTVVRVTSQPDKGIRFARFAKCVGLARGVNRDALALAEKRYGDDQGIVDTMKAAVDAATVGDGANLGFLVGAEGGVFADFADFLRPMTVIGAFGVGGIPELRRVPFRRRLLFQDGGGDAYWTGEGKPKGVTSFTGGSTLLEPLKAATIAVASKEILRDSSPSADVLLRDQIAAALAARLDQDFIDTTNSGSSFKPASITNGASPITSEGNDAVGVRADVKAAMSPFTTANNRLTSGVWLMSATRALSLQLMRNALGQREFADISMRGGSFEGLPVIVSEYLPTDKVVLVNAADIYLGDEGGVSIDVSTEASLQMDSSPSDGAQSLVSLWQNNLVGFLAERTVNWALRREEAVQVLESVAWGDEES